MEVESAARIKLSGGLHKKKQPKCGICGKEFCSMKGLYGHMRTHPDRSWRGIEPPNTVTTTAPAWSLTAPRGRKRTTSASTSDFMLLPKKESSSRKKVHFDLDTDMGVITCQYSAPRLSRPRESCGRKMLDFDLNQLPPMEEEDGEGIES
ncbi:uncharacterized protein LOC111013363 [Momordica charantia]|uniref:Uncharacterized protein LOC111013363 n=1 Tax=Momordica charantia TaxID=3673 RepID=A0A6J1CQY7_MOMCH|nr:uncharacterized protein LOC111013363 [Momordica charantia]